MSPSNGWRMTRSEYPSPRNLHAIEIRSAHVEGYIAVSTTDESWTYYVPSAAGVLVNVTDAPAARAFAQELPSNGVLYFPEPTHAQYVQLHYHGGFLAAFVPMERSAALATEATLREILDALRALRTAGGIAS